MDSYYLQYKQRCEAWDVEPKAYLEWLDEREEDNE